MYTVHHSIPGTNIPLRPTKEAAMAVAVGLQIRRQPSYVFITDDYGIAADRTAIAQYAARTGWGWVFN
jgi:hypothetical protein